MSTDQIGSVVGVIIGVVGGAIRVLLTVIVIVVLVSYFKNYNDNLIGGKQKAIMFSKNLHACLHKVLHHFTKNLSSEEYTSQTLLTLNHLNP